MKSLLQHSSFDLHLIRELMNELGDKFHLSKVRRRKRKLNGIIMYLHIP
jgi:hypothetical protein